MVTAVGFERPPANARATAAEAMSAALTKNGALCDTESQRIPASVLEGRATSPSTNVYAPSGPARSAPRC